MNDTSLVSGASSSKVSNNIGAKNVDGQHQSLFPVSRQVVGSLRTISDAIVVVPKSSLSVSSFSSATTDAASKDYHEFLVELNQSSALGLTASELQSLVTVSANVLLNCGTETSDFKQASVTGCINQRCLKRSAEGHVKCNYCHLNSGKTAFSEFEAATSVGSVGDCRVAKCRKEDTAKTAKAQHQSGKKSEEERAMRSKCRGCRTLSLAILQQFGGSRKRSQALTCTHELFPHYEPQDEQGTTMRIQAETMVDYAEGLQPSPCPSPFDQCRVICLSEREHLILCKYEKATESFENLNKALRPGNSLQIFLLRRKPEVHVSGERFDDGILELLREIRRATLWWASRRNNPRKQPQTQLPVPAKPAPKSADTYRSSPDTSLVATSKSDVEVIGKICTDYPDCRNSLINGGRAEKCVCLPVLIHPRQKHTILVAYEKEKKIVDQLTALFKFENCEISLLRRKSMFHVSRSKPGSVTVFMLQQLVQRAISEQEIEKWLMERGILPGLTNDSRTAAGGTAAKPESRETKSFSKVSTSSKEHGSRIILCSNPICSNTKKPEEVQGINYTVQVCHPVQISPHVLYTQFLKCNKGGWLENQLAEICKGTNRKVRICLMKELPAEFHIYDPENRYPSLLKDLEVLVDLCVNEVDVREYVERLVKNTLKPWVCADYPDCTNSNESENNFKFFRHVSPRCCHISMSKKLQQFLLSYPLYREKMLSELFKLAPDLGAHQLRICLLKHTNALHVRCSKHDLVRQVCDAIQKFVKFYNTVSELRWKLDGVERSPPKNPHPHQAPLPATTVWTCENYPDCTNSKLGEADDGDRCRPVPIRRWKVEKALELGFKQQLEMYFRRCIERVSRGGVRVCLLKNRNEFHVRGNPSHQDRIQKRITEIFSDINYPEDLRSKLSKLN